MSLPVGVVYQGGTYRVTGHARPWSSRTRPGFSPPQRGRSGALRDLLGQLPRLPPIEGPARPVAGARPRSGRVLLGINGDRVHVPAAAPAVFRPVLTATATAGEVTVGGHPGFYREIASSPGNANRWVVVEVPCAPRVAPHMAGRSGRRGWCSAPPACPGGTPQPAARAACRRASGPSHRTQQPAGGGGGAVGNDQRSRSAAPGRQSACWSWTSTASSRSTTRWVTTAATKCCKRSPVGCTPTLSNTTLRPGSAATEFAVVLPNLSRPDDHRGRGRAAAPGPDPAVDVGGDDVASARASAPSSGRSMARPWRNSFGTRTPSMYSAKRDHAHPRLCRAGTRPRRRRSEHWRRN